MVRTGAIFNSLTYGGIDSADYGIYISGEGVYNAPERAVELVSVPGRNGAIAIDQGHWENIEVTYPAGVFGSDKTDFATAISSFRNAILSQKGYQRLSDTYHPDEYREGLYIAGLEVDPVRMTTAGEFDLIFNCKPQRWLTSGESAVTVANNGTVTNPTKYDASPLLQVWGYGKITMTDTNGEAGTVELANVPIGDITLQTSTGWFQSNNPYTLALNLDQLSAGDSLLINKLVFKPYVYISGNNLALSVTNSNGSFNAYDPPSWTTYNGQKAARIATRADLTFTKGTSSTVTNTATVKENGTTIFTLTQTVAFNGTSAMTINQTVNTGSIEPSSLVSLGSVTAYSTKSALGSPIYFDLDIGEAYKIASNEVVSVNNAAIIPAKLPTLKPGANTITYDNTVTQLKLVPKWWQL